MSTPDEPATMTVVPLDANSDFACQPRSSSAEASYVFRCFQVRIETATSPPTIVAPLGDVVDMGWERACKRLAEAMLARFPSDRILHTETLPESEELEGVAIRLRNGGARFHLTPDPERGCHFFNLPGHRILHRLLGTTRDVPDARLEFEPPGEGRWDVILRVNESRHQYDRLWYVPRPRDGDLAERARPIQRADWQPQPLRRPAPRTRQPKRRDDLLFVRRSRQR